MVIKIKTSFAEHQANAQPTFFGPESIQPPPGSLGDIQTVHIPPLAIPPVNTSVFLTLSPYNPSDHVGLADESTLPAAFDWGHPYPDDTAEIISKKKLISGPGNQALCGSCWAISGAGIISDNFVVSGLVTWMPNLSTTWTLACNPQKQCGGGNPQEMFKDVAANGITTNHCVDYSWCSEDPDCNGKATKHFQKTHVGASDLNKRIPTCGCYYGDDDHYVYRIDANPKAIAINPDDDGNKGQLQTTIKQHVYTKGPALGAFLVFKNFMKGDFMKMNGGVYLETGVYTGSDISFDSKQVSSDNYVGGHAVAIVGWGVERGILTSPGKKEDVPFWYARNSWTDKWGSDGGYFKMAMWPWNKTSVFDATVTLQDPSGPARVGGGVVLISASQPPIQEKLDTISDHGKLAESDSYYQTDPKSNKGGGEGGEGGEGFKVDLKGILYIAVPVAVLCLVFYLVHRSSDSSRASWR